MSEPVIHPVGDDALALRVADRAARHAIAAALRASGHWRDVVPGKREVTVQFDPAQLSPQDAAGLFLNDSQDIPEADHLPTRVRSLTLVVDEASAPDLERVAEAANLSPGDFLHRLCTSDLIVDMMGFTPGFAYVDGVDTALTAERRPVPRQKVAAGSVGILTGQLGLYALSGPAGWPIIGRIAEPLFDPGREKPFLLDAGDLVQLTVEWPGA